MLSDSKMVTKARRAFESMYNGTCTVVCKEEYEEENGATSLRPVVVCENEPCRMSFGTARSIEGDYATATVQEIRLFLAPEKEIPVGSDITVTQDGRTTEFALSGAPVYYATHQEITLSRKDRWA